MGLRICRQQISFLRLANIFVGSNFEMNVGCALAIDAFNLMVALRTAHADVALADIDRLPSIVLIDLGVAVTAHLSLDNSWMSPLPGKCVLPAFWPAPNS